MPLINLEQDNKLGYLVLIKEVCNMKKYNIILISGVLCSDDLWIDTINNFPNEFDCQIVNLGFTGTFKDLADNLAKNIEKSILVGFSAGGYLAQYIANKYSSKIMKLVLVNSSCGSVSNLQQNNRIKMLRESENMGSQVVFERFLGKLIKNVSERIKKKIINNANPEMFIKQIEMTNAFYKHLPDFRRINTNTKFIFSLDDPFFGGEVINKIKYEFPDVESKIFTSAGHMLPYECPKGLSREIVHFIS